MKDSHSSQRIVVIDDDPMQAIIIAKITGERVVGLESIQDFESQLKSVTPSAFFVDIHLGLDENGLDGLPKLKSFWPFAPIIVVTGTRNEHAVGEALASGADDFLYKPFHSSEVVARMQARSRELSSRIDRQTIYVGDLKVDLVHRCLSNQAGDLRYLSMTEMNILRVLMDAKGTVVRREDVKKQSWGQIIVSDNALNRKLHGIRHVLKDLTNDLAIRTVYGTGLSLEVISEKERKIGA